jgi:hypothetical protein
LLSSIAVWNRNKKLIDGYIAGDVVGNGVFGLNVLALLTGVGSAAAFFMRWLPLLLADIGSPE